VSWFLCERREKRGGAEVKQKTPVMERDVEIMVTWCPPCLGLNLQKALCS
jgi:hypothetical protein